MALLAPLPNIEQVPQEDIDDANFVLTLNTLANNFASLQTYTALNPPTNTQSLPSLIPQSRPTFLPRLRAGIAQLNAAIDSFNARLTRGLAPLVVHASLQRPTAYTLATDGLFIEHTQMALGYLLAPLSVGDGNLSLWLGYFVGCWGVLSVRVASPFATKPIDCTISLKTPTQTLWQTPLKGTGSVCARQIVRLEAGAVLSIEGDETFCLTQVLIDFARF
ncbi:hypothetical protein NHP190003_13340 [Helicobacter sp. NHP19-003]|uniref:Uncharacterized protein n=1 Tax=Helicobacter gastrocanis TaxID=2849641 RepID=A0ABN6I4X4_9HELI|nr:hypothetical protein [Helicobacter sp. NHP19-003]BCZ18052.1 hypothetical protein NHP190003_13340 [Helicobacter sp. NHP19-003]